MKESIRGLLLHFADVPLCVSASPSQITVRDEGCLKYLKDITWSHLGEGSKVS